jgi:hypothetical protein
MPEILEEKTEYELKDREVFLYKLYMYTVIILN